MLCNNIKGFIEEIEKYSHSKEEIIDNVKVDKGKKDKANIVVMDDVVEFAKEVFSA